MVGYLHGVLLDLSINKICGQDSIPIKSSTCGVFMLLQQISIPQVKRVRSRRRSGRLLDTRVCRPPIMPMSSMSMSASVVRVGVLPNLSPVRLT
jgi:hypothetical protein